MLTSGDSVLFVCTGNTCRSPMAEYLAIEKARERGLNIEIASRGIFVSQEDEVGFLYFVNPNSVLAVQKLYPQSQIDKHKPIKATPQGLKDYNLILTMQEMHVGGLLSRFSRSVPGLDERVFTLIEYTAPNAKSVDIPEPEFYGTDLSHPEKVDGIDKGYLQTRDVISSCLDILFNKPSPSYEQIVQGRLRRYEEAKKLRSQFSARKEAVFRGGNHVA